MFIIFILTIDKS